MENKIKEIRIKIEQILKEEKVNYIEWKMIAQHIETKYERKKEESTL